MEREILFRAKNADTGEWVYGWYCKYPVYEWPLKACIIPSEEAESSCIMHVEVDPKTVGQYTGLKDEYGKSIFEGDIVQLSLYCGFPNEKITVLTGIVEFYEAGFSVRWLDRKFGRDNIGAFDAYYKVVGNIYENPPEGDGHEHV